MGHETAVGHASSSTSRAHTTARHAKHGSNSRACCRDERWDDMRVQPVATHRRHATHTLWCITVTMPSRPRTGTRTAGRGTCLSSRFGSPCDRGRRRRREARGYALASAVSAFRIIELEPSCRCSGRQGKRANMTITGGEGSRRRRHRVIVDNFKLQSAPQSGESSWFRAHCALARV